MLIAVEFKLLFSCLDIFYVHTSRSILLSPVSLVDTKAYSSY